MRRHYDDDTALAARQAHGERIDLLHAEAMAVERLLDALDRLHAARTRERAWPATPPATGERPHLTVLHGRDDVA